MSSNAQVRGPWIFWNFSAVGRKIGKLVRIGNYCPVKTLVGLAVRCCLFCFGHHLHCVHWHNMLMLFNLHIVSHYMVIESAFHYNTVSLNKLGIGDIVNSVVEHQRDIRGNFAVLGRTYSLCGLFWNQGWVRRLFVLYVTCHTIDKIGQFFWACCSWPVKFVNEIVFLNTLQRISKMVPALPFFLSSEV